MSLTSFVPQRAPISANEVKSSGELKKGYRVDKMHRRMTPADHISIATKCGVGNNKPAVYKLIQSKIFLPTVCLEYFNKTSGARKPLVPALGAATCLLKKKKDENMKNNQTGTSYFFLSLKISSTDGFTLFASLRLDKNSPLLFVRP